MDLGILGKKPETPVDGMTLAAFQNYLQKASEQRKPLYMNMIRIFKQHNIEYKDLLIVLDFLNAQVIIGAIGKDKFNCIRCADLLAGATKKLMVETIKKG